MQARVKTEYFVDIHPNGWDEEPAYVFFPDEDVKKEYTLQEAKYCKVQRAAYLGAVTKQEVNDARHAYLMRRVQFARSKDYAPSIKDPSEWYYQPSHDKLIG